MNNTNFEFYKSTTTFSKHVKTYSVLGMVEGPGVCVCGGGGGYLTKFNTGRLRPEVQPLTLLYIILAEKVPLLYTFYWEKVPLSHTYFRTLHPLSKPLGEYQALREEKFCKQVLFIQFSCGRESRYSGHQVNSDSLGLRPSFATFIKPFHFLCHLRKIVIEEA